MPDDISNRALGGKLTLEGVIGFLITLTITLGAVSYASGQQDEKTSQLSDDVSALEIEVTAIRASVHATETTVASMAATQGHFQGEIDELKEGQKEIIRLLTQQRNDE